MKKEEKALNNRIKKYAGEHRLHLPNEYDKRVDQAILLGTENAQWQSGHGAYFRYRIAFAVACVVILSGFSTYAAVNYVQQRMNQVSDRDKQNILEDLQGSESQADSFSRELSKGERKRLENLLQDYQAKGVFPDEKIVEIQDVSEVLSDRICFLPETSTFYLPELELSDEDLLELIDFYFVRDYSLRAENTESSFDMTGVKEISEQEAVKIAKKMVERVFVTDVSDMEIQIDYQQGYGSESAFSVDYISFVDTETDEKYDVTVNMQTGEATNIEYNTGISRYADGFKENVSLYKKVYKQAEKMAKEMLNEKSDWKVSKIVYSTDENGELYKGCVNYYFITKSGKACCVGYSCALDKVYWVCTFTEEGIIKKEQSDQERDEKLGIVLKKENM